MPEKPLRIIAIIIATLQNSSSNNSNDNGIHNNRKERCHVVFLNTSSRFGIRIVRCFWGTQADPNAEVPDVPEEFFRLPYPEATVQSKVWMTRKPCDIN